MLTKGLEEILDLIMNYVDRADTHNVDKILIEQEIQDIEDLIESLAMKIEEGDYELYER